MIDHEQYKSHPAKIYENVILRDELSVLRDENEG
jgi:hypothetical protein